MILHVCNKIVRSNRLKFSNGYFLRLSLDVLKLISRKIRERAKINDFFCETTIICFNLISRKNGKCFIDLISRNKSVLTEEMWVIFFVIFDDFFPYFRSSIVRGLSRLRRQTFRKKSQDETDGDGDEVTLRR